MGILDLLIRVYCDRSFLSSTMRIASNRSNPLIQLLFDTTCVLPIKKRGNKCASESCAQSRHPTDMAKYKIDSAHSAVTFKIRHMMIAHVKGEFTDVTGTVDFDPADTSAASIEVIIAATSIHTREPQRDGHLRSADFLDVSTFPEISFRATGVLAVGSDAYQVIGDLTIHGITKKVALKIEDVTPEAKDPWGGFRRGASASTTINRKDFGLTWNAALEAGGWLVGDDIQINIDVELVRPVG